MICIKVAEVILGGLGRLSCFVIKGLTCYGGTALFRVIKPPPFCQVTDSQLSFSVSVLFSDEPCQVFGSHIYCYCGIFIWVLALLCGEKLGENHCFMRDAITWGTEQSIIRLEINNEAKWKM